MAGLSGIVRAAHGFLRSEKGKRVGGRVIDGAARAADKATRGKHGERIASARRAAERGLRGL